MRNYLPITLLVACLLIACQSRQDTLLQLVNPEDSGIHFSNELSASGRDSLLALSFEYLYNGGGVSIADFDNDGLPDIFFTGNMSNNALYRNLGDLKFEDITSTARVAAKEKWCIGSTIVDINNDGFDDIYVSVGGLSRLEKDRANLLYINQGDLTFKESAAEYGLDDGSYSINAVFLDYDKDGDEDMYLLTTELDPYSWTEYRPRRVNGEAPNTDKFFINNGDGTFSNISSKAGVLIEGYGLGIAICDINNDNWLDIYVANDFLSNDVLYINNQNGGFEDKVADYFQHTSRNSMGIDIQDFNNDGLSDIIELDMLPKSNLRRKTMFGFFNYDKFQKGTASNYLPQFPRNTLQLNNGNGTFSEIGQLAGVDETDWSWSSQFVDLDNDGWRDLFITNGFRQDITNMDFATYSRQVASQPIGSAAAKEAQMMERLKELPEIRIPNFAFKNSGSLTFEDVSTDWGISESTYSNGAAYADLDNDGDLDYIINNIDNKAHLYENRSSQKEVAPNYIKVTLTDNSNKSIIGSKVSIYSNSQQQYSMYSPYRGYLSSNEQGLHFGLGNNATIDSITVIWPDNTKQIIGTQSGNQIIEISKSDNLNNINNTKSKGTIFSKRISLEHTHQGSDFTDFKIQPILPHQHSKTGPGISVGDINGDGLDDLFVSGGVGQSGKIFNQLEYGSFVPTDQEFDAAYHEMGSLLFDADSDGDLDLYIVSGGTAFQGDTTMYQDRLYINDGRGQFSLSEALPKIISSGSSVIGGDYDNDGDIDLFIGGRVSPGAYPTSPRSYLLRNDSSRSGLKFTNISDQALPNEGKLGMVTSAVFSDYNNDGNQDLIIVGEWMPITLLTNNDKKFTSSTPIKKSEGWWNSITAGDFDNDGDTDYALGNLGLNSRYTPNSKEPITLYADDYDNNGRVDPIMTQYINGKEYPVHSRDMLIKQVNGMRNRFKTYTKFGNSTISETISKKEQKASEQYYAYQMRSGILKNNGGDWEFKPLPTIAQVAPINGMITGDYDGDNILDLLAVGNDYSTDIMIGQYDANFGILMKGTGDGTFIPIAPARSGLKIIGDAEALVQINSPDGHTQIVSSINNDKVNTYHLNEENQGTIEIRSDDKECLITFKDGSTRKYELSNTSYLSQSSRSIPITPHMQSATITNLKGEQRNVLD